MGETQGQHAERQERIAQAALLRLDEFADQLEAVADEVFVKRVPYQPDNGADVMALSFVTKQREHLRSVRTLISVGQHRDAHLLGRTMIEGLGRLLWAFNKVPERTDLWFWFGAILDWRQILKNEALGMSVDSTEKAELKGYVDQHGPDYFRDTVRKALDGARQAGTVYAIPDDPWGNDWTATKVESMFVELGAKRTYDGVYRDSSEWVHWGPRAILRAMDPAEWGVSGFTARDWRAAAVALQLGCQSLLQSLEILDAHFSLGRAEQISELETKRVAILDSALETGR